MAAVFSLRLVFLFALCLSSHIVEKCGLIPTISVFKTDFSQSMYLNTRGKQVVELRMLNAVTGCLLRREVVDKIFTVLNIPFYTEPQKR